MHYTDPRRNANHAVFPGQPPRIDRYSDMAIALHWLIAVAIFAMLALGLYMVALPTGLSFKADLINFHKSLGLTILLLVLARIAVRAVSRPPPDLPMPAWQRIASRTTHVLLYVAMIVMPVSGYLGSSFNTYGTRFWGIALPRWGWDDKGLRDLFFSIHNVTMYVLIALITLHVLGTLKHQFIDRDNLFSRMLP
jgi:cytochrome b561